MRKGDFNWSEAVSLPRLFGNRQAVTTLLRDQTSGTGITQQHFSKRGRPCSACLKGKFLV